jgi:hypothetical protein
MPKLSPQPAYPAPSASDRPGYPSDSRVSAIVEAAYILQAVRR